MIFLAVLDAVCMMIVYAIYLMIMALFYTCVVIVFALVGLGLLVKGVLAWALNRCQRRKDSVVTEDPNVPYHLTSEGKVNYAAPKDPTGPRDWRPRP